MDCSSGIKIGSSVFLWAQKSSKNIMITSNVKCVMKLEKITEDCILHRMNKSAQKLYKIIVFESKISISQTKIACLKFQSCLFSYIYKSYIQWRPLGIFINEKYSIYFCYSLFGSSVNYKYYQSCILNGS